MAAPFMQPFTALRPAPGYATQVAARPYDVLSVDEARAGAAGKPWSFLHVSRAEIDLPEDTDVHGAAVYAQAAAAFTRMIDAGVLVRETTPCYYTYRMIMGDHVQTGVAAGASVLAYEQNRVRRHEHTRPEKEIDRTRQIEAVCAHTGPVLVAYPPDAGLASLLQASIDGADPIADATTDEGTRHQVWLVHDPSAIAQITRHFEAMQAVYIADGHHRAAAAARLVRERREKGGGAPLGDGDDRFLVIGFPADALKVLDYNRVVRDLNGLTAAQVLDRIGADYQAIAVDGEARPTARGMFGLFLDGRWYRMVPREPVAPDLDPVGRLDVSLLQERVLRPILGIADPRTDSRIDFVGGGRGLRALADRVRSGEWAVAFALYPTALMDVIQVADAGLVMPPKSTWFEPKLADGLLALPLA
jgi:uncharacterized protein (DUF1015 family)